MIPFGTTPHYPLLAPSHSWLRINSFIPNGHLRTGASQKLKTASSYFRFVAFSSLYLPPSNPNSSSYAKHLVKTFKTATKTVRGDKQSLNQKIASCLLSYQPVPPTYRNACLLNCCWWEDVCRRRGALRLDSSTSQLLFFFFRFTASTRDWQEPLPKLIVVAFKASQSPAGACADLCLSLPTWKLLCASRCF